MYTPILATLGYVFSEDRRQVLMVHRTARAGDQHLGKWNGLGGKVEPGEDVAAGMARELREEAHLTAPKLQLAGTVSWPGFGKKGEDWFGFVFRVLAFDGSPPDVNAEGRLAWVEIDRVLDLSLWEGDRLFLPRVFDLKAPPFHGVMPYKNGKPVGWTVTSISA